MNREFIITGIKNLSHWDWLRLLVDGTMWRRLVDSMSRLPSTPRCLLVQRCCWRFARSGEATLPAVGLKDPTDKTCKGANEKESFVCTFCIVRFATKDPWLLRFITVMIRFFAYLRRDGFFCFRCREFFDNVFWRCPCAMSASRSLRSRRFGEESC